MVGFWQSQWPGFTFLKLVFKSKRGGVIDEDYYIFGLCRARVGALGLGICVHYAGLLRLPAFLVDERMGRFQMDWISMICASAVVAYSANDPSISLDILFHTRLWI